MSSNDVPQHKQCHFSSYCICQWHTVYLLFVYCIVCSSKNALISLVYKNVDLSYHGKGVAVQCSILHIRLILWLLGRDLWYTV